MVLCTGWHSTSSHTVFGLELVVLQPPGSSPQTEWGAIAHQAALKPLNNVRV